MRAGSDDLKPEHLSMIGQCYKHRPWYPELEVGERGYWKLLWPMGDEGWYCEQLHINTRRTFRDERPIDAVPGSYPSMYIWFSVIAPYKWDGDRIPDAEYADVKNEIIHLMGLLHTADFPLRGTLARQAAAKAEEWIRLALRYEEVEDESNKH